MNDNAGVLDSESTLAFPENKPFHRAGVFEAVLVRGWRSRRSISRRSRP